MKEGKTIPRNEEWKESHERKDGKKFMEGWKEGEGRKVKGRKVKEGR